MDNILLTNGGHVERQGCRVLSLADNLSFASWELRVAALDNDGGRKIKIKTNKKKR